MNDPMRHLDRHRTNTLLSAISWLALGIITVGIILGYLLADYFSSVFYMI